MSGFDFWQFIAGVAVFIYAMSLIEDSLKHLAGRSFKKFLQKQSQSKFKMTIASTAITALLQSSSVVILMVLSFVGAGLMPLKAALAAILGCNLGTTFSSWVVAQIGFKINFGILSFPLLGLSLLGLLFFRKKTTISYVTSFLIGFAFLFISLEWLKTSLDPTVGNYFRYFSHLHYLLFIPIGFLITGIVQSSSLTMALSLNALYHQLVPIESAAAIVIGSELGTSLKFLWASKSGLVDKKRLAWGNFLLNIFTIIIAAIIMLPFLYYIKYYLLINDELTRLVFFQSGINLVSLVIFFPMLGLFSKFLERRIKDDNFSSITRFIGNKVDMLAVDAIELAKNEIMSFLKTTINVNKTIFGFESVEKNGIVENLKHFANGKQIQFDEKYVHLKFLHGEIQEFISEIKIDRLNEVEVLKLEKLTQIARLILKSAKNMKDIRHNLEEFDRSANDVIFLNCSEIKKMELNFYQEYILLLYQLESNLEYRVTPLEAEIKIQYDKAIIGLTDSLKNNKISEIDSSSLQNVYREIYSSNTALVQVLSEFHLFFSGQNAK